MDLAWRRRRTRIAWRCPWHDEQTPSCYAEPDGSRVQCFGCGKRATWREFEAKMWRQGREAELSR